MKIFSFWPLLLLLLGTTFTFFNFSIFVRASSSPDFVPTNCADSTTMIAVSRKLKENGNGISSRKKDDTGHATLDDYQPVDPVPSSKTSLKPGPIEHGSPLNPFIPKPSPPPRPPAGGF